MATIQKRGQKSKSAASLSARITHHWHDKPANEVVFQVLPNGLKLIKDSSLTGDGIQI